MEPISGQRYAVVTGDVVGSTRLTGEARSRLNAVMREGSQVLRRAFTAAMPFPVDFYRGDGWQFLCARPELSLRMSLVYRTHLRAHLATPNLDTRLAIGIGPIDFLPEDRVTSGDGLAFQASGQALDSMPRDRRMGFNCPQAGEPRLVTALQSLLALIDALAREWTSRQSQAMQGALLELTQSVIGQHWKPAAISQQAVAQHLQRAGWQAAAAGLAFFEETVTEGL
jgi:hypothetical protein